MKTKHIFLLAIFALYCIGAFAQSANRNYILTRTYTVPATSTVPPERDPVPDESTWILIPNPFERPFLIIDLPIRPGQILFNAHQPLIDSPLMDDNLRGGLTESEIISALVPGFDIPTPIYLDLIQYFDGLGRSVETVQKGITPAGKDLVSLTEYDAFGRESNLWLPAVVENNFGAYLAPSVAMDAARTTNTNSGTADQKPYSRTVYEASPLNRPVQQFGPGAGWHDAVKAVKTEYLANLGTSSDLVCVRFDVIGPTTQSCTLSKVGHYANAQLHVTKTTDEDGNISYEFKDKLSRTMLVRRKNGAESFDTYYIFDDFGNLCYVIPPEASYKLTATDDDNAVMKQYVYMYKYDRRNRRVATKLPGCDWTYFVYDKADRLIFSQNGEQRKRSEWTFAIPDVFGRTVLTGTCKNSLNWSADDPLGASAVVKATRTNSTNTFKGYSVSGVALNTPTILTADWYDDYGFMNFNGIPPATDADFKYESVSGYGEQYTEGYKGMLTGSWRARLDGSTNGVFSIMYYDNRGRVIQTKSRNHLGGMDKVYFAYNFSGQTVKMKTVHSATSGGTQKIEEYAYTYDHAGRLTKTTLAMDGGAATTIAENTYDELGRLKENKKGGNNTLKTTYAYNVRSWTKSISGTLFNQTLYYNESYGGSSKRYGGDVSAMSWQQSNEAQPRGYTFAYDGLSRLTAANYLINGTTSNNYKTSYTYDKHGNLKTLQRYGKTTTTAYGIIDNLTSILDSNRITKITDAGFNVTMSTSADFKDYSGGNGQYLYDTNGSLTKDTHKGILGISYNVLNLPRELAIKNTNTVGKTYYVYSADGVKLQTKHLSCSNMNYTPIFGSTSGDANLNIVKTTDYVGNRIYENGSLKRVLFDGGYIEGGVFYYYITDHLGNVRVVANSSGTVIQRNHYYPYGMAFAENTVAEQGKQPYKYNGKELDQMHRLNLYDYSARQMEPALGRFTTMDPMCESYYDWSPYAYVNNNPMKYVDPTGMFTDWYQYEDELIWRNSQAEFITENKKTYRNIGSSATFDNGDGSFSSFYQNVGFRSDAPLDAFGYILSNPEQLGKQLSSGGNLPDFAKTELLKASIHAGQEEFASHPVTKATVKAVTFIASGAIEGAMALGSLGAGLFTKAAVKGGIQLTKKTFGHTFTTHGDDMTNFLFNRAKGSGMPQGQFLNNQKAAQFILDNVGKTANGAVNIPIPKGFPARVIMPDGTFRAATHIRLVPGGGGVKTAYPLIP